MHTIAHKKTLNQLNKTCNYRYELYTLGRIDSVFSFIMF